MGTLEGATPHDETKEHAVSEKKSLRPPQADGGRTRRRTRRRTARVATTPRPPGIAMVPSGGSGATALTHPAAVESPSATPTTTGQEGPRRPKKESQRPKSGQPSSSTRSSSSATTSSRSSPNSARSSGPTAREGLVHSRECGVPGVHGGVASAWWIRVGQAGCCECSADAATS